MKILGAARIGSSPPLRRGAAGAVAGFAVYLGKEVLLRSLRVAGPIDNAGLFIIVLEYSLVWASLCGFVFAALRSPLARSVVVALAPFALAMIGLALNVGALGAHLGAFLLVALSGALILGLGTALVGDRLVKTWGGNASP